MKTGSCNASWDTLNISSENSCVDAFLELLFLKLSFTGSSTGSSRISQNKLIFSVVQFLFSILKLAHLINTDKYFIAAYNFRFKKILKPDTKIQNKQFDLISWLLYISYT